MLRFVEAPFTGVDIVPLIVWGVLVGTYCDLGKALEALNLSPDQLSTGWTKLASSFFGQGKNLTVRDDGARPDQGDLADDVNRIAPRVPKDQNGMLYINVKLLDIMKRVHAKAIAAANAAGLDSSLHKYIQILLKKGGGPGHPDRHNILMYRAHMILVDMLQPNADQSAIDKHASDKLAAQIIFDINQQMVAWCTEELNAHLESVNQALLEAPQFVRKSGGGKKRVKA